MKALVLIIAASCALASCAAPTPPYQMTTPFADQAFQPWSGAGSANLDGQAFLKTVGGDVKTCAGEKVSLLPATAYTNEIIAAIRSGKAPASNVFSPMGPYILESICDAQGNFSFRGIQARAWVVLTQVGWDVPNGNNSILIPEANVDHQGGEMAQTVALHAGGNRAILTGADELPF